MTRIALVGASGFVGSAVHAAALDAGHTVDAVVAPRLAVGAGAHESTADTIVDHTSDWLRSAAGKATVEQFVDRLGDADVVVNAAGLATPDGAFSAELLGANTALPAVVALAAAAAAAKCVHVSSASVQARLQGLDETAITAPNSPYSTSKACAEDLLRQWAPGTVIYRATSVQGAERRVTQTLVRLVDLPLVPLASGEQPLPLSLIDSTASAIVHIATMGGASGLYLHPWEGVHTGNVISTLGGRARRLPVPVRAGGGIINLIRRLSGDGERASLAGVANRLSLLLEGRPIDASRLVAAGWTPNASADAYRATADSIRSS